MDFPRSGDADQHRLMLDADGAKLRFRMRLYDNFGYTCVLAELTPSLTAQVAAKLSKRVSIDFIGAGIREVTAW